MHTFCHVYQKQINTSGDLKIVSSDMVADKIEMVNIVYTIVQSSILKQSIHFYC